jgi:ABC-type phosphate transport system ATPase subunit
MTKKIELQERINILEKTDYMDLMLHENYCNNRHTSIDNINKISEKISLYDTFICKELIDSFEIRRYICLIFDNIDIKYENIKFPLYFNNENKRKRKYDNLKDIYYNYKKKNINTNLLFQEFIEYNKKLKM